MKKALIIFILLSIVLLFGACNDPIFFIIHEETAILKPKVDGSPKNFVVYNNKLYTASGKKIFSYDGNNWTQLEEFGDFVIRLASTSEDSTGSLYAIYVDSNSGRIKRYYSNSSEIMENIGNVQSIHAVDDVLFASVRTDDENDTYAVYYKKESDAAFTKINEPFDSMLNGLVSDTTDYYFCTNKGIYYIDKTLDSLPAKISGDETGFTGIVKLIDGYFAAITEEGKLFEIYNKTINHVAGFSDSRSSTGALAVWYKDSTDVAPSLLLAGRKEYYYSSTTAYSNGYVEIALDPTTGRISSGAGFTEPGKETMSSIDNNDRYVSSLGKEPINHIIQTPASVDSNRTLFASTQQKGVWSYREREGVWQWNAED